MLKTIVNANCDTDNHLTLFTYTMQGSVMLYKQNKSKHTQKRFKKIITMHVNANDCK